MRLGAAAAFAAILSAPAAADTLVDNVDGMTLDAAGRLDHFTGLLIGNDGRVVQVLRGSEKRPARADYRLDGKGRVLMPGMIDSHVNLMALGLSLLGPAAPGARPRPEDRDIALAKAQAYFHARGITAVADMGTSIEAWQAYRRAGDLGQLTLRIMAYAGTAEAMVLIGGPGPSPWLYEDRLRFNGLYAAQTGAKPPATPATARETPGAVQLKNLLSRAAIDGFQIAVDVPDAKAATAAMDAIDEMASVYKGERRWRLELSPGVDSGTTARLVITGSALGFAPSATAPSWQGLAAQKVRYSFGSNAPAAEPAPFGLLGAGLAREESLAGLTVGAAWAGFADGRFGRIAPGQRADFILMDRDPMLAAPSELKALRVLQTWVGGKLVWQASSEAPSGLR